MILQNSDYLQKIEIINTTEIGDDQDRPSRIIKTKPDSSMNVSVNLLKNKVVDAVISAGNTGCLLSSSFFNLGTIEGIRRPALFAFIPSENGDFLFYILRNSKTLLPFQVYRHKIGDRQSQDILVVD